MMFNIWDVFEIVKWHFFLGKQFLSMFPSSTPDRQICHTSIICSKHMKVIVCVYHAYIERLS